MENKDDTFGRVYNNITNSCGICRPLCSSCRGKCYCEIAKLCSNLILFICITASHLCVCLHQKWIPLDSEFKTVVGTLAKYLTTHLLCTKYERSISCCSYSYRI